MGCEGITADGDADVAAGNAPRELRSLSPLHDTVAHMQGRERQTDRQRDRQREREREKERGVRIGS